MISWAEIIITILLIALSIIAIIASAAFAIITLHIIANDDKDLNHHD